MSFLTQLTAHWRSTVLAKGPSNAVEDALLKKLGENEDPVCYAQNHLHWVLGEFYNKVRGVNPIEYRQLELRIEAPIAWTTITERHGRESGTIPGKIAITGYAVGRNIRRKIGLVWVSHPFWQQKGFDNDAEDVPLTPEERFTIRSEAAKKAWRTRKAGASD